MNIVILIFDGITALDAIGPYEVLKFLPKARIMTVAKVAGMVYTDKKLGIMAEYSIYEIKNADILIIPGGIGTRALMKDREVLDWVLEIHETTQYTVSVCTGALILGSAGLLQGLKATTHWAQMDRLKEFGADPVSERVVFQGKIITAAGVSAGIDMALMLTEKIVGKKAAQMVQLGIEYDPEPPYNCGSPAKAPEEVLGEMKKLLKARESSSRRCDNGD